MIGFKFFHKYFLISLLEDIVPFSRQSLCLRYLQKVPNANGVMGRSYPPVLFYLKNCSRDFGQILYGETKLKFYWAKFSFVPFRTMQ